MKLIRKDGAAHAFAHSFPPLAELRTTVVELGGQLMACTPCLDSRELKAPHGLEPGFEVIGAARLVAEITAATSTLTY